eukprot:scaffold69267_cov66-Phaeocystis_antarctica.AAC.3
MAPFTVTSDETETAPSKERRRSAVLETAPLSGRPRLEVAVSGSARCRAWARVIAGWRHGAAG